MHINHSKFARAALVYAAFVVVTTGCPAPGPTPPEILVTPQSLLLVAGVGQQGLTGSALAITPMFRVVGAGNAPLEGVAVTFVSSGTSTLSQTSAVSNRQGEVSPGSWTLGNIPGEYTVVATVSLVQMSVPLTTSVTAIAIAKPGVPTPALLTSVAGDAQTAQAGQELANDLVVLVRDATGSPIAGVSVVFSITGGGQVSQPASITNSVGRATIRWTLGSIIGVQQLVASITGTPLRVVFSATASAPMGRLEIVTQPSHSILTMLTFDQPPVVRAISATGTAISTGEVVVSIDGTPGASVQSGSRAELNKDGQARFSALSVGATNGNAWLTPTSTLVRLRFEALNLAPVLSDTIRLTCFNMALPLDRAFNNSGTIQQGDCVIGSNFSRDFFVDVPPPASADDDNAVNLLYQQTMSYIGASILVRGFGARDDERFIQIGFGNVGRRRILLGPGRTYLSILGDQRGSLVGQPYTFSTSVQPVDVSSPCSGDQTFIPMQSPIAFTQVLSTADCRLTDRTYADRYGVLLAPGATMTITVEALGTSLPGLAGYLYSNSGDLNQGTFVEVARAQSIGRTSTISMKNSDVNVRLYSFAVSAIDPASVGRYRARVSFNRP